MWPTTKPPRRPRPGLSHARGGALRGQASSAVGASPPCDSDPAQGAPLLGMRRPDTRAAPGCPPRVALSYGLLARLLIVAAQHLTTSPRPGPVTPLPAAKAAGPVSPPTWDPTPGNAVIRILTRALGWAPNYKYQHTARGAAHFRRLLPAPARVLVLCE